MVVRNCDGVFGCLRFIRIRCARVGAIWTDGKDLEVEAEWARFQINSKLLVL